jgi:uridine kinase
MIILKRLIVRSPKYLFDLDINGTVTLISGDSGSGKTLLMQMLKYGLEDPLSPIYDKPIILYSKGMDLRCFKNNVIFIDNFDSISLQKPEIIDLINNDNDNQYVLISRAYTKINVPLFNCCRMQFNAEKKQYELSYYAQAIRKRVAW